MAVNEKDKKYFYEGHSQTDGRVGDLYVLRKDNCWHINAGVYCCGHNPGYGVWYDVRCDSKEFYDFEQFLQKTERVQQFIKSELGADSNTCDEIFGEIWNYIHQTVCN